MDINISIAADAASFFHPKMFNLNHSWTQQEERLLQVGVRLFGHKWEHIRKTFLPDISSSKIKNKFYSDLHKQRVL